MREAVSFSVVLKFNIWVGEYNTINQHNCKKNCTIAKKKAQLQKKQHNCKTNCTSAKKNVLLALTTLLLLLILMELNMELNPIVLKSMLPCHPATANKVATSRVPSCCLSRTTMPQSGTTYLVDRMPWPSLLSTHNFGERQWSNIDQSCNQKPQQIYRFWCNQPQSSGLSLHWRRSVWRAFS